jgi:hypothetical protein
LNVTLAWIIVLMKAHDIAPRSPLKHIQK